MNLLSDFRGGDDIKNYTPKEVAQILKYEDAESVYRLCSAGLLVSVHVTPRHIIISERALERYLEEHTHGNLPECGRRRKKVG